MAAKLVKARDTGDSYHFRVHIDTTKTVDDGTGIQVPDPAYVREWTWSKTPPADMTDADYQTAIRRELRGYVADELTRMTASDGVPLPSEGQAP